MRYLRAFSGVCFTLLAGMLGMSGLSFAVQDDKAWAGQSKIQVDNAPPSDSEIRERTSKVISNQHADDLAIEQYERIERQMNRSSGANPRVLDEKTYRVVPTGTGSYKILLKSGEHRVEPEEYKRQLRQWAEALKLFLNPNDPREKSARAKYQKRTRDRNDLVEAAREAFLIKWVGREYYNDRVCAVIELEPNPDFHPRSLLQDAMTHVTARVWIDEESNQVAQARAHVSRDISIGGGILGKLYRGGTFSLQQDEVAPGIWLPTRYQYDFMGRKFFFIFEQHQLIEVSHYKRIGTPQQALAMVQQEIASGETSYGDP